MTYRTRGLTKSQIATIDELDSSECQGAVKNAWPLVNGRARVYFESANGFTYSLYVGKKGRVYDCETGSA